MRVRARQLAPMATMADIAKKAGVSRATASYVINDRQAEMRISDETSRRVLDAMRELGYRRNDLARAVKSGKSFVVGYLQRAHVELETQIQEGVLKTSTEAGYLLKLLAWGDSPVEQVARLCVEQRLAGVITRSLPQVGDTIAFFTELESYGIPVVFLDDSLDGLALPRMSWVTSDDDQGIRLAVEHLIGLGHRDIAFVGGYLEDRLHPQEFRRLDMYRQVMAAHDLAVPEEFVLEAKWNIPRTEQLVRELFDRPLRPTALLCAGAEPALVAIRTLRRMGLNVPDDVSVVGYSDFAFATLVDPPLTTISQPFEEMGTVATQILLKKLQEETDEEEIGSQVLLPTTLIVRESTTRPRTT